MPDITVPGWIIAYALGVLTLPAAAVVIAMLKRGARR